MTEQAIEARPHALPLYQCHKRVRAAKITALRAVDDSESLILVFGDIGFEKLVGQNWLELHPCNVGSYFVEYEDGYTSASPGPAFEAGYTLLADGGQKIYRLNDYEWWAGPDLESCIRAAMEQSGNEREDVVDEPYELTDEDAAMVNFVDCDEPLVDGVAPKHSLRQALERAVASGVEFPYMLGCTEA